MKYALLLLIAGCGAREQQTAADESGLVLLLPADWVESREGANASWSGARRTREWRTTVNVHSVPVATDEVTRSVDAVARALLVEYAHMGAQTRLSRGQKVAGQKAVRLDVRFDHDGTRYRRRQFVLLRGDRIVHLDATAPAAHWERVEPVLQRAVETARWEDT